MLGTYLKAIEIGDILDVALLSVLIYALLIWFKRAKAAFVVRGMLVTVLVYLLARVAGMEMTITVFHGIFAILAVAMVVIFQEELRRVFERIAVWSLSGGKIRRTATTDGDLIVRVVHDLARDRMGALIVLRGQDPLDRHLHGGWSLDGALSEPLLKSIFDRNSVGHDGAVIVNDQQVTHFGCRLPLSRDFERTNRVGTRHAAALGLAELTDALCIVVSEERGSVSVARHGHLEEVPEPSELEQLLVNFAAEITPQAPADRLRSLRTRNARPKLLAFASSFILWLVFVFSDKRVEHEFEVPVIATNAPAALNVAHMTPDTVRVQIDAKIGDFFQEDSDLLVAKIDLAAAAGGVSRYELAAHHVTRPVSFTLLRIDPAVVEIKLVAAGPSVQRTGGEKTLATEE